MKYLPKFFVFLVLLTVPALLMIREIFAADVEWVWLAWTPTLLWLSGGLIGYVCYVFDRFVDIYATHPDTELAVFVKEKITQPPFWGGCSGT